MWAMRPESHFGLAAGDDQGVVGQTLDVVYIRYRPGAGGKRIDAGGGWCKV